jgi:hypothetical protein
MEIVEESGSGLATQSQTLYLAKDGAEKEKAEATIKKLAASTDLRSP